MYRSGTLSPRIVVLYCTGALCDSSICPLFPCIYTCMAWTYRQRDKVKNDKINSRYYSSSYLNFNKINLTWVYIHPLDVSLFRSTYSSMSLASIEAQVDRYQDKYKLLSNHHLEHLSSHFSINHSHVSTVNPVRFQQRF